jgi:hypothetical protein
VNNGLTKEENAEAAKRNWGLFPVYDLRLRKLVFAVQFLNPPPFTTNTPNECYQKLWELGLRGDVLARKALQIITSAAKGK